MSLAIQQETCSQLDRLRLECELYLIAEKKEVALAYYDKLLAITPNPFLFVAKAKLLEGLERYDEAIESFEQALRISDETTEEKTEVLRLILDLKSAQKGILNNLAQSVMAGRSVAEAKTELIRIRSSQHEAEDNQEQTVTITGSHNGGGSCTITQDLGSRQPNTKLAGTVASSGLTAPAPAESYQDPTATVLENRHGSDTGSLADASSATVLDAKCAATPSSSDLHSQPPLSPSTGQRPSLSGQALTTGSQFSRYQILKKLGQGGMGTVYQVHDTNLDRIVALKLITGDNEALARRFLQEVKATAKLKHPNIIGIYDFGDQPQHYFTMEYVDGQTLSTFIQQGTIKSRRAAEILKSLAQAIAVAHDARIIHRDIKPGNVMLDLHGNVKVMDFGLAKFMEGDSSLSKSGDIIGTPAYMSPEQAAGGHVDERSDIYSIGAVGYEMITGRAMFHADTVLKVLSQVANQDPRNPRSINLNIDRDLETIIVKCVEKSPAKRYQTARDLEADLLRYLDNKTITAKPPTYVAKVGKWVRRNPWLTVAIVTLITSITTGFSYVTYAWQQQKRANQSFIILNNMTRWDKKQISYAEVENEFRKALALSDNFTIHQMWGQFAFDYALTDEANSVTHLQTGVDHFRKAIALNPDDYVSRYFMYVIDRIWGDNKQAEQEIRKVWEVVAKLDQENEFKYAGYGLKYSEEAAGAKGRQKEQLQQLALDYYTKALKYNPYMFCVHNFRGAIQLEQKNYREAEASFNRSLAINKQYQDALWNRGRLYLELACDRAATDNSLVGKYLQNAKDSFEKALSIMKNFGIQLDVTMNYQLACLYSLLQDEQQGIGYLEYALQQGVIFAVLNSDSRLAFLKNGKLWEKLLQKYKSL